MTGIPKSLRTAVMLTLACTLVPGVASAGATDTERGFRLLQFEGYHVKWGDHALGSGARVTYAFVNEGMNFDDLRNCASLVPMNDLTSQSGISVPTLTRETAAAFRVWEQAADIAFTPAADPAHADILIGAQGTPRGRAYANVAYRPEGKDGVKVIDQALICLNPSRRWKVGFDGDTDVYDLRYTLIHEIGHAIGLDHPGPSGQLMSFGYDEGFHELQPGDLRGAARLYGVAVHAGFTQQSQIGYSPDQDNL